MEVYKEALSQLLTRSQSKEKLGPDIFGTDILLAVRVSGREKRTGSLVYDLSGIDGKNACYDDHEGRSEVGCGGGGSE